MGENFGEFTTNHVSRNKIWRICPYETLFVTKIKSYFELVFRLKIRLISSLNKPISLAQ